MDPTLYNIMDFIGNLLEHGDIIEGLVILGTIFIVVARFISKHTQNKQEQQSKQYETPPPPKHLTTISKEVYGSREKNVKESALSNYRKNHPKQQSKNQPRKVYQPERSYKTTPSFQPSVAPTIQPSISAPMTRNITHLEEEQSNLRPNTVLPNLKENLVTGIVMAEILGPPKAKKRRG